MSEEKEIMDFLGIGEIEGNIRGEHCGKILTFLKINDGKSWDFVKDVAPFQLGIGLRYLQENYLRGIVRLKIIRLFNEDGIIKFKWFGSKALNGQKSISSIAPPEKKKLKNGVCGFCGKKISETKVFCNEECVRGYYKKGEK